MGSLLPPLRGCSHTRTHTQPHTHTLPHTHAHAPTSQVALWDLHTGERTEALWGHRLAVTAIDVEASAGDLLLSTGVDGAIMLWHRQSHRAALALLPEREQRLARFWPGDPNLIAAASDRGVALFDLRKVCPETAIGVQFGCWV